MSRVNFIYFIKKHIIKHKIVLYIFSGLLFTILLGSCKTCDCPAYSKNNRYFEELELEKINISLEDSLFATQILMQNTGLTN